MKILGSVGRSEIAEPALRAIAKTVAPSMPRRRERLGSDAGTPGEGVKPSAAVCDTTHMSGIAVVGGMPECLQPSVPKVDRWKAEAESESRGEDLTVHGVHDGDHG